MKTEKASGEEIKQNNDAARADAKFIQVIEREFKIKISPANVDYHADHNKCTYSVELESNNLSEGLYPALLKIMSKEDVQVTTEARPGCESEGIITLEEVTSLVINAKAFDQATAPRSSTISRVAATVFSSLTGGPTDTSTPRPTTPTTASFR